MTPKLSISPILWLCLWILYIGFFPDLSTPLSRNSTAIIASTLFQYRKHQIHSNRLDVDIDRSNLFMNQEKSSRRNLEELHGRRRLRAEDIQPLHVTLYNRYNDSNDVSTTRKSTSNDDEDNIINAVNLHPNAATTSERSATIDETAHDAKRLGIAAICIAAAFAFLLFAVVCLFVLRGHWGRVIKVDESTSMSDDQKSHEDGHDSNDDDDNVEAQQERIPAAMEPKIQKHPTIFWHDPVATRGGQDAFGLEAFSPSTALDLSFQVCVVVLQ